MNTEMINSQMLATIGGLAGAVNLAVQVTKAPIKERWGDMAIRLYTLVISMVLTFLFLECTLSPQGIALQILNSFLVYAVATGVYENVVDPYAVKSK